MLSLSLNVLGQVDEYTQRFLDLYEKINDPANGYFSADGVPYHSVETLICEAPDHGHETTSEAYSYWIWLEAMYGGITGDWNALNNAWTKMEQYAIPTSDLQPTSGSYNPSSPATYASEHPTPMGYPSPLESNVPVGVDPVSPDLTATYGSNIYGMHWLFDLDNFYGYGNKGDGVSTPSYINTFQRGEQESVWETVPHPSWEDFSWGSNDGTGFLSLYIDESAAPAAQWRYTNAPDADARAVQAMYWATQFAKEQGLNPSSVLPLAKASKMGDFVRLAMFDKYFKPIGVQDKMGAGGTGYESAHYLISWYYAWGGPLVTQGWAWRIGSSHNHFGYQNPVAAYALSEVPELQPISQNGVRDWGISLDRQLEFYTWLQSAEGGIAGGATNSWNGSYDPYPAGTATFYDMAYDDHPVYHDPGSNQWFGMQAWSMERIAELYYISNDSRAKNLLDNWVAWVKSEVHLFSDGTFEIPSTLQWSGSPNTWNPANPQPNNNLHVTVSEHGTDLGIAACLAKALIYYAAGTREHATLDAEAQQLAKEILDRMWANFYEPNGAGVAAIEPRGDFSRFFDQEVYIPAGWSGQMANGDVIEPGVKFIDIRSKYREDPSFPALEAAYNSGQDYESKYHRFWAQADIALANAEYGRFFEQGPVDPVAVTGVSVSPVSVTVGVGQTSPLTATVTPSNATDKSVTWGSNNNSVATVSATGLVTGISEGSATITVTTNDGGYTANSAVTVTDIVIQEYDLTTSVSGSGSISLNPAGGTYQAGTSVTLTAVPAAGYIFQGWSGDAAGSASQVTVVMNADKSVTATFVQEPTGGCDNPSTISLPFQQNGAGTFCFVTSGTISYVNSWNMSVVEINGVDYTNIWSNSMPPRDGGNYYIYYQSNVGWSHLEIDGQSGTEPTFYTLTTTVAGQGSVSPASGSFEEGTSVTLTATPAQGYAFSGWSGDVSGSASPVTLVMNANKSVTAIFTQIQDPDEYNLTVNVVGQGSVQPNGGTFVEGTTVTLTATPASGWVFAGWSGDASGTSISASVLMNADKMVTATFTEIPDPDEFTLTVTVVGNGSVVPNGGIYTDGTVVQLTATAGSGYSFDGWSGDASGSTSTVSVTMNANKAVVATFSEDEPVEGCENPISISIPFVQNGVGQFCWVTTTGIAYVNSWNLNKLTINGVDFTNTWSNAIPPAQNGQWIIEYDGPYGWSHFEAPQAKAAQAPTIVSNIEVYPNPFSNELNIDISELESVDRIELMNSLGQVVQVIEGDQIASDVITLDVAHSGSLFILRVHTSSEVYVKSVIKQ
jgi:uncharacterized repeat protein (TIGR02543 family)